MIRHHISHMDEETKKKNIKLYQEIHDKGTYIKSEWNGDYLITTYEYQNKTWELWENMEYGILSEVRELEN